MIYKTFFILYTYCYYYTVIVLLVAVCLRPLLVEASKCIDSCQSDGVACLKLHNSTQCLQSYEVCTSKCPGSHNLDKPEFPIAQGGSISTLTNEQPCMFVQSDGWPNQLYGQGQTEWCFLPSQECQAFEVTFDPHFDIDNVRDGCDGDDAVIVAGQEMQYRFCGNSIPSSAIKTGGRGNLTIKFKRDKFIHGIGFRAKVCAVFSPTTTPMPTKPTTKPVKPVCLLSESQRAKNIKTVAPGGIFQLSDNNVCFDLQTNGNNLQPGQGFWSFLPKQNCNIIRVFMEGDQGNYDCTSNYWTVSGSKFHIKLCGNLKAFSPIESIGKTRVDISWLRSNQMYKTKVNIKVCSDCCLKYENVTTPEPTTTRQAFETTTSKEGRKTTTTHKRFNPKSTTKSKLTTSTTTTTTWLRESADQCIQRTTDFLNVNGIPSGSSANILECPVSHNVLKSMSFELNENENMIR